MDRGFRHWRLCLSGVLRDTKMEIINNFITDEEIEEALLDWEWSPEFERAFRAGIEFSERYHRITEEN